MFIAAYGTLRPGLYNFKRFGLTHVKTATVTGFELYDLGPYPYVVRSDDPNSTIVVDILEADKPEYDRITRMELGADYEVEEIEIDGIKCTIYVFESPVANTTKIENGDYKSFKGLE